MERRVAKELLHIEDWFESIHEIVGRGKASYLSDKLLQEAGDSLMMKLGEAANRLAKLGVLAPDGVEWAVAISNRNFVIHQYDAINRTITWETLAVDLPEWEIALHPLFDVAQDALSAEAGGAE